MGGEDRSRGSETGIVDLLLRRVMTASPVGPSTLTTNVINVGKGATMLTIAEDPLDHGAGMFLEIIAMFCCG